MKSHATVTIEVNDEITDAVDCCAEFDFARKMWRAWDDLGNEAHDDLKTRAMLRVIAMRLGAPMQEDNRG